MKLNKLKIFLLMFATILITSCDEDNLDMLPEIGSPLETMIQDEDDVAAALQGVYDRMSQSGGFGANISIFGDLISDNIFVSNDNDGYFVTTQRMNWSPEISDFSQYDVLYDVIQQANLVINVDNLEETQQLISYKAEAKIARALAYYYLISFYASNPTSGQFPEYGVPLLVGKYNPNEALPRATINEVYDLIISDLKYGIENMLSETPANKGYLSPTAGRLLLSRVYLTRGASNDDYLNSIEYSNQVISSAVTGGTFDFVSEADYVNYFSSAQNGLSENRPETVFEINFNSNDNPGINAGISTFYSRTGSHKSLLFRQSFKDLLSNDQGDVRWNLLDESGAPDQDDPQGVWTKKWPRNTQDEGNYTINVKILRMSEAKLNKIEALYHLGQTDLALTLLNEFKGTRGGNSYNANDLLMNILIERRKEFFGEGQRFFDLKRNNLPIDKGTNCNSAGGCFVEANSKLFVLPIPRNEIINNPNISQHPLWQ